MSGQATLTWHSNVGFELDLSADLEDIRLRFAAVPVPADGTIELAAGVDLNKLDVLFKCQAVIDGVPAQLQDATIIVANDKLILHANLEDVENGLLYPLEAELSCSMPAGVPKAGGTRNVSPDEDDLDWGDDETFEAIAGDVPDAALLTEEFDEDDEDGDGDDEAPTGLAALLDALKNIEEEGVDAGPATEEEPDDGWTAPESASVPGDQKMSVVDEAIAFLEILIQRDELELEEGFAPADIGRGVSRILELPINDEAKATRLSEWLLEEEAVADLFIDDESLAAIVAQW